MDDQLTETTHSDPSRPMQSIVAAAAGLPETLQLTEVACPRPEAGEVRIRVAAAGVNYADVLQRRGTYPLPTSFPWRPGSEVAGVVDAVGGDVRGLSVGQRVAAWLDSGGYAERVLVSAERVFPMPDDLPFAEATALLVQGVTAASIAERLSPVTGRRILVTAAAGGVGSLLVQLLAAEGAEVLAGVSTDDKAKQVLELGARSSLRYDRAGWAAALVDKSSPVNVVVDAVGGDVYREALALLAPGGSVLVYGASSGELVGLPASLTGQMIFKNQTWQGHALPSWLAADPQRLPATVSRLFEAYSRGALQVLVHPPFSLAEAAQAHQAIERRQTIGKVVLIPSKGAAS